MAYLVCRSSAALVLPVRSTVRVIDVSMSSPLVLHHWFSPAAGAPYSNCTGLSGNTTTTACALLELYSCGPSSRVFVWPETTTS
jgi:hypothetical protein